MFNMRTNQIDELCHFAMLSDQEIRSDLCAGYIVSENDYTSNLTGAFRRNVNSYSKTGLVATSKLLDANNEQKLGCDAAIIVTSGGESKVAIFEAKWPRLSKSNYSWDYPQTSAGLSHFSDQLSRQAKCRSEIAIFEIFYCEHPFYRQPSYMKDLVSSCLWHDDAYQFKNSRPDPNAVWTQSELVSFLKKGNIEIGEILKQICQCKKGSPIAIDDYELVAKDFQLPLNILHINADSS